VNYASALAAVGFWSGVPTVLHLGLVYDYPSPIFSAAIRKVDLGVAPSEHTADGWRKRGWPARSLRVIPNGVDTAVFQPGDGRRHARQRLQIPDGQILVAYVGRLVKEKGVFTLLKAFAEFSRTGDDGHLLFVGPAAAGEDRLLREAAQREGLADGLWEIRGSTSTPEDVYRAADVVVVPSEWDEPFGLAPIEAAACGTLPLVSDRGVLSDLVGPHGGRCTFPSGDAAALADRLHYWLADAGRRERQAQLIREHVEAHFTMARCGDAYLQAFESLLAS
jgi:glycosyltransferase involved in cell wall biosynthesis